MRHVKKDRAITRNTKLWLLKILVFPVFLYGAETWTIKVDSRRGIDVLEMWAYRRMLRMPWMAKRTNMSILTELRIKQRLSSACYQQILRYLKHIGGRPTFSFGTGGHPRNCVRDRVRFPFCGRARNFSKSYGLYFVIFPSYFFIFSSYFVIFSPYFFIFHEPLHRGFWTWKNP